MAALEERAPDSLGGGYAIERKLGTGSYATVWLARRLENDGGAARVAVKAIERRRLTKKLQENLESEIAILRDFSHPHLVGFVELRKKPDRIFLVLEYLPGGDLQKLIRDRKRLRETTAQRFMGHLASGLEFLSAKNLIHRDLKPQNLLLTEAADTATLKIADFGFARHLETAALAETLCGSPLYMAPEILSFKRYDAKADLWSVGAVRRAASVATGRRRNRARARDRRRSSSRWSRASRPSGGGTTASSSRTSSAARSASRGTSSCPRSASPSSRSS
jgi:serine/threonine-protein kinase ULK/ATG1